MPTDGEYRLPDCPVSFSVGRTCHGQPLEQVRIKRLEVGSVIPLTFQWSVPDDWLAQASQRLAALLYRVGMPWQPRWGRWRMDFLETEAKVVQDNEAGLELRTAGGAVVCHGRTGIFANLEGLLNAD